ncbi:FAD-dependent oxidoreductase [Patescibacteria group bacterium]|nr:FAD-dependent oxidoreductase [Patescibacteria group bacterium]
MYDLIIIGGGPAAITAGIYAARKKIKVLLLTKSWGGQMAWAPDIDNYPGVSSVKGLDLVNRMVAHLKENELEIKEGAEVKEVSPEKDFSLKVKTAKDVYSTKALLMATGRTSKKINAKGEEKFIGKGISYCAVCDAPLYRDKAVAVIGGGNTGLNTALEVAKYAAQVYLLGYRPKSLADEYLQTQASNNPKITFYHNVLVKEFKGDEFVGGLVYEDKNTGDRKELAVGGVFVAIGSIPNSSLVENMIELNEKKEIKIDHQNATSVKNIFAAGDVTDVSHKQIIVAAGEGAKAALNACNYLNQTKGE